ncbi:MAG TPA: HNH endonuclease, partial [Acidimicrobiia bacterium]|nr:HNH endonuclease [Acidimicrobiia bacterium]
RFPGCHNRRWVHGHHILFWSEGGPTDLCNLITLCPRHHRMLHEEGWRIEGDPNREVTFIKPNGRIFARAGP